MSRCQHVRIGIAQFSSHHLDLEKSLEKLGMIVKDAYSRGVQFLVFGETWLSGYPAWLDHCPDIAQWNHTGTKRAFDKFHQSSVSISGSEMNQVSKLAREYSMMICLGINERVDAGPGQGTVYNSVVLIDAEGRIQNHHRKLMPTYTEKIVYGFGDGAGLRSVATDFGKITTSICWEHWMPLTRQALHNEGEHIHIALWPTVHEMHQVASRHYAFEGRCYVVAVGQILRASDFPETLELPDYLRNNSQQLVLRGGSCIVGPDGIFIAEPVFDREELIVCDIDPNKVVEERMTLDVSGHYQRNDVFDFQVNRKR